MRKEENKKVVEVLATFDGKIVPSEEELKRFKAAFWRTYNIIADDANLGPSKVAATEIVLDADRVHTFGKLSEEELKRFDLWIQQEVKVDYKKGIRNLSKLFWSR